MTYPPTLSPPQAICLPSTECPAALLKTYISGSFPISSRILISTSSTDKEPTSGLNFKTSLDVYKLYEMLSEKMAEPSRDISTVPQINQWVSRFRHFFKMSFNHEVPLEGGGLYPNFSVTFTKRLVTYLQASQYRLLKAYQLIAAQERQERLINSITAAIRHSLNPQEILKVAIQELGRTFEHCHCLLYRCDRSLLSATIKLEVIFDCFSQEEGDLRRLAGGTGLGLAICRQIIQRLGGQIWAESLGKNQGSQFHFSLPIE